MYTSKKDLRQNLLVSIEMEMRLDLELIFFLRWVQIACVRMCVYVFNYIVYENNIL